MSDIRLDTSSLFAPVKPIDAYLLNAVRRWPMPDRLRDAVEYALLGGGKRLRPLLCWYWCAALGVPGEESLPGCAAIELVHAFSLVHDDLPALDNDDLRRGRPTLHRYAGEAMAILAGDAMLNLAYSAISESAPPLQPLLVSALSHATHKMVAGQVYDLDGGFPGDWTREMQVRAIHERKTGALMQAACTMGHHSARHGGKLPPGPLAAEIGAAVHYGQSIGIMFQIVDDLIDLTQTAEHTGKRTRKDAAAGKLTYPAVFGEGASRREVQRLRNEAIGALATLKDAGKPLADLCEYLCVRTQ
jgi:geranylgeranyl diphosphate synthase, type II